MYSLISVAALVALPQLAAASPFQFLEARKVTTTASAAATSVCPAFSTYTAWATSWATMTQSALTVTATQAASTVTVTASPLTSTVDLYFTVRPFFQLGVQG